MNENFQNAIGNFLAEKGGTSIPVWTNFVTGVPEAVPYSVETRVQQGTLSISCQCGSLETQNLPRLMRNVTLGPLL